MRRVAGDEPAAVAEFVGDQPASDPVLFRDDLIMKIRTNPENRPDAGIAVDGIEIALARLHVIMHQPALAAIDRIDHAGATRVDRTGPPRALVPLQFDQ